MVAPQYADGYMLTINRVSKNDSTTSKKNHHEKINFKYHHCHCNDTYNDTHHKQQSRSTTGPELYPV